MTTDGTDTSAAPAGLRSLVYAALPSTASPTDTACQPLSKHVLDHAQDDVVELTRQRMSEQFGDQLHVVIVIRDGDLDPSTDGELTGLLEQTRGGVLVFGVAYAHVDPATTKDGVSGEARFSSEGQHSVRKVDEDCPECGTLDPIEISRADEPDRHGRTGVVFQCRECGTDWDSYLI